MLSAQKAAVYVNVKDRQQGKKHVPHKLSKDTFPV
jgi:hypothetical protein